MDNYFIYAKRNLTKFRSPNPFYVSVNPGINQHRERASRVTKIDYEKGHKELCRNTWQEGYTKLHHSLLQTKQNKFIIYTCREGGWGNRVRELLDIFHFAVITNRAFILFCNKPSPLERYLVPRNVQWNHKVNKTHFKDRFRNKIILSDVKDPSDPLQIDEMLNSLAKYPTYMGREHRFLVDNLRYDLKVWPNLSQMNGCSFYYLFQKSKIFQKRLNEWKKRLGFHKNIVLAIHFRLGDSVAFKLNYSSDKRFQDKHDIDIRFECAVTIQKKIEKIFHTRNVVWFLAADSEKMKADAMEKYGKKVRCITGPIQHIAHPRKGNEDAALMSMFLDYFLLQEADYRFYATRSSLNNAVDFITLGKKNAGRFSDTNKHECILPPSLTT